jgi:hypothetical protein
MPSRRLTSEQQTFIVTRLATFDAPAEVRDAFKAEYGIELTLQALASYDPTVVAGARDLSDKLKALFAEARATFLKDVVSIPIASSAYRLRQLDAMARAAKARKNYPLAAQLLEQASKETGGMFTNLRKYAGPHGEPLPPMGAILRIPDNGRDLPMALSEEDRIEGIRELLERAFERMASEDPEFAQALEKHKTRALVREQSVQRAPMLRRIAGTG